MTSRRAWVSAAAIAVVIASGTLFALRRPAMQTLGWFLVAQDPLAAADAIVVPHWAGVGGALEAADLVRGGYAPRVIVLRPPPEPGDAELERRDIYHWRERSSIGELLKLLGVTSVEVLPTFVNGTEEEGEVLQRWCESQRPRALIVVSAPDHSRRLRRTLRRDVAAQGTSVIVRYSRLSPFDPNDWWSSRRALRIGLEELPKLLLDVVRHPFS
jgi:hypothetical protein